MLIALVIAGLHCYALRKRIAYLEQEINNMKQERTAFMRAFDELLGKSPKKEGGQ
jgi:hypothetical protein